MSTDRGHTRGRGALALVAGLAVVAALAGMAACGGGDEPSTSPTTSGQTTTTPSTTAPLSPEEEAKAVYLELVDHMYSLMTTAPDPQNELLASLAAEPLLGTLRDSLGTMQAEHHLVEKGSRTGEDVLTVAIGPSTNATLRVCSVGNDTTVDQDDGTVVAGGGISTRLLEVSLVKEPESAWHVNDIGTIDVFEGEVECPR